MDSEKMKNRQVDEEVIAHPGFRFHPTDEELVGFYLRRMVDHKKQLNIDFIRQIDIYKYDPWDLPLANYDMGNKEWYFFCRRGRKYRNSVRPNRVTCSGFWKATGIDHPIYSVDGPVCIGLKKSLVYYRGSAGKGTKTEWMMHEFRLPPSPHTDINTNDVNLMEDKAISQEAEVWTLCRILKRNTSHKKNLSGCRKSPTKRNLGVDISSKTRNEDSNDHEMTSYISFQPPIIQLNHEKNPLYQQQQQQQQNHLFTTVSDQAPSTTASSSTFFDLDISEIIKHGDWDDLRSVIEFDALNQPVFFM